MRDMTLYIACMPFTLAHYAFLATICSHRTSKSPSKPCTRCHNSRQDLPGAQAIRLISSLFGPTQTAFISTIRSPSSTLTSSSPTLGLLTQPLNTCMVSAVMLNCLYRPSASLGGTVLSLSRRLMRSGAVRWPCGGIWVGEEVRGERAERVRWASAGWASVLPILDTDNG